MTRRHSALGLTFAACLSALLPFAAQANTALLIVNDRYAHGQNLRGATAIEETRAEFLDAGFDVILVRDATGPAMRDALEELLISGEDERILIAAIGHFARARSDTWLLGRNADAPNLANVAAEGLALSTLFEVASVAPGQAVVLLGQERRRMALGPGLGAGLGRIDPPQGVTVVAGSPGTLAGLIRETLLVPGADLGAAIDETEGLRAFGFLSPAMAFLSPDTGSGPALPPAALPQSGIPVLPPIPQASAEERELWDAVVELDTPAAYRAYAERYPNGVFINEARTRLSALEANRPSEAETAETALALTGPQRRTIQRHLRLLGYYDRGIDGIFGPGTRAAISAWQAAQGRPVTGFLDAIEVAAIDEQATRRAAEIEEQERLARDAAEREDRAYWQLTGQGATEEGARTYLDRYPNGIFADQARARLGDSDRAAWDRARQIDSIASYQQYLDARPNGAFADRAIRRLREITRFEYDDDRDDDDYDDDDFDDDDFDDRSDLGRDGLEVIESRLNLPPVTRSIVEQRLTVLGYGPGRVDGRFDPNTRQAIAAFQVDHGLDATGYLDQATLARLLSQAFGDVIRLDGVFR